MNEQQVRSWLGQIHGLLQAGNIESALQQIRDGTEAIRDCDSALQLSAVGTVCNLLEMCERLCDAVPYRERLIELADQFEPFNLNTARDHICLARLYERLGRIEDQHTALTDAFRIFERLSNEQKLLLEDNEIGRLQGEMARAARSLARRHRHMQPLDSQRSILISLLDGLQRAVPKLAQFPDVVVQYLVNDLLDLSPTPLLESVRCSFQRHLTNRPQPWIELKAVHGPGQHNWHSRRGTRYTEFPEVIKRIAPLPRERLLAVSESGRFWITEVAGIPKPISLPSLQQNGSSLLASNGNVIAFIDTQWLLRFAVIQDEQPTELEEPIPNMVSVIAITLGFFAVTSDGTMLRFDQKGCCEQTIPELGMTESEYVSCSSDGAVGLLAKNLQPATQLKARLKVIDLIQRRVMAETDIDFDVRAVGAFGASSQFMLGSMLGVYLWNKPWDAVPTAMIRRGTTNQIVLSEDGRYVCLAGGNISLNDCVDGVAAGVGIPGDAFSLGQVAWSGLGNDVSIHVTGGNLVSTIRVSDLPWAQSVTGMPIEVALFDEEGRHFAGVGIAGEQYFWEVEKGHLLESEKGGAFAMPFVVWSEGRRRGAVCHENRIDILEQSGNVEFSVTVFTPALACWDRDGLTLAFVSKFDRRIRIISFHNDQPSVRIIDCSDPYYPSAIALTADGQCLGCVQSLHAPVNYGLAGLGTNIKVDFSFFGINDRVVLCDFRSGEERLILDSHPKHLAGLSFLSNRYLLGMDVEDAALVIDTDACCVVARWWAQSRGVGIKQLGQEILFADSGEGTVHSPVVYRLQLHNLREG